ncbi:MAG: four helix bundle protein [Anaerolineales bacterium]
MWEKAHRLALTVYRDTQNFPRSEMFGLQAQMRRASVSVTANIAEGSGRSGKPELAQFLNLALGSASDFLEANPYGVMARRTNEVKIMLTGLIRRVKAEHQRAARLKTED